MAMTLEAARLTQAHAQAQSALNRRITADMVTLWALLDPTDIDGTFPRFLQAATAILSARKRESASVAAAYYRAFREAEGVGGRLQVAMVQALAVEQAAASLAATGPVTIKMGMRRGLDLDTATKRGLVATLGASSRLALAGGRDTIHETMMRDEKAFGVARVTRGGSCAFCAMLASRGPVYKEETAKFRAHDHCNCASEVVYDRDNYEWPGGDSQRDLSRLYAESTKGLSGKDAENAFRRAYEARQRQ